VNVEKITRACLQDVSPYLPGKPVAEVQRELGLEKVIKLSSNENFLGPSPKALACLKQGIDQVHIYPEGASPLLRRALAEQSGVAEGNVLIGNGSDEITRLACETLLSPEDEVVCSEYAFIRFKQQSLLMGARVVEVPMRDWVHDLQAIAKAVTPRTKMVFVASPNNPTGTYNTAAEVAGLLEQLPSETILLLDEAYYHYAAPLSDYPESVPSLLKKHRNLFVMRTFSKAYGLAGLRVGYGIGDPELVSWLDRIRMPFNVNLPGQEAALEAVKDHAFIEASVSQTSRNREWLRAELTRLGLHGPATASNFLFVKSPLPGRELFRKLLALGVIVRPLDEYGLPEHIRISVGSTSDNKTLVAALEKVLPAGVSEKAQK
jgi:histidinol-phosphate aminotransferase